MSTLQFYPPPGASASQNVQPAQRKFVKGITVMFFDGETAITISRSKTLFGNLKFRQYFAVSKASNRRLARALHDMAQVGNCFVLPSEDGYAAYLSPPDTMLNTPLSISTPPTSYRAKAVA